MSIIIGVISEQVFAKIQTKGDIKIMRSLEKQAKEFIKDAFWGYANGVEDCGVEDYPLLTKEEYKEYIWKTLEYEKNIIVNGLERKHIYFLGKANFLKLVDCFLENEDCKEYIKK